MNNRKDKKEECMNYITSKDQQGKIFTECRKHYCICKDKFIWGESLDNRYQKAKLKGEAKDGIFFNK